MDDETVHLGARYLAPSGLIWTVRDVRSAASRVFVTTASTDGDRGAVMDTVALGRMISVGETTCDGTSTLVEPELSTVPPSAIWVGPSDARDENLAIVRCSPDDGTSVSTTATVLIGAPISAPSSTTRGERSEDRAAD
jgi:hypothetical protein